VRFVVSAVVLANDAAHRRIGFRELVESMSTVLPGEQLSFAGQIWSTMARVGLTLGDLVGVMASRNGTHNGRKWAGLSPVSAFSRAKYD